MSTVNLKQLAREYGTLMYRQGCTSARTSIELRLESAKLIEEFDAAVDALERDTQDAQRWQTLRAKCCAHGVDALTIAKVGAFGLEPWSGDDPDRAIDARRLGSTS